MQPGRPVDRHQSSRDFLSDNFYWIRAMTSQDSTDELDPFLTCPHLNTGQIMQISGEEISQENIPTSFALFSLILLIIGSQ